MLGLTRVRAGDRGAVAMIVAMLFGFGVMIGLAALTIDVGNINADRRQLQNGADAVALAVAQQCAHNNCTPIDPTLFTIDPNLQKLVDANAADGATAIRRVDGGRPLLASGMPAPLGTPAICGNLTGLFACPTTWVQPSITNLQECPAAPPSGVKYVRVYTETLDKSRTNTLLPYYFGAAITGIKGANQQACAQVAMGSGYGEPAGVTDALCAWNAATSNGTDFPALPPYIPAPKTSPLGVVPVASKYVVKVLLQGNGSLTDPAACGKNDTSSGQYTAGNFGWLDTNPGTCIAAISNDEQSVGGSAGGSISSDCETYLTSKIGEIIYIPIFVPPTSGTGENTVYAINGVSAFFLAGYQAPGASGTNIPAAAYATTGLTNYSYCLDKNIPQGPNKDDGCIWGWYVTPIVDAGKISEGTPRGPFVIGLNG